MLYDWGLIFMAGTHGAQAAAKFQKDAAISQLEWARRVYAKDREDPPRPTCEGCGAPVTTIDACSYCLRPHHHHHP